VSEPVTTQFGVHLIKVLEARTEVYASLDEKRQEIVASLRRGAAEEIFTGKVRELDELAFESSEGLEALSTAMGLEIQRARASPVTRVSVRSMPRCVKRFLPKTCSRSFNSRAVDLGDRAVVVLVVQHHPALRRSLPTSRPKFASAWRRSEPLCWLGIVRRPRSRASAKAKVVPRSRRQRAATGRCSNARDARRRGRP
jgi:peptidyl-prolyl cis-trans isomerase D